MAEVLQLPNVNLGVVDGAEHAGDVLESLRLIGGEPLDLLVDGLGVLP